MTVATSPAAAGDVLPGNCELIEVRVSELKQLFNAIDPSPFGERDLDPDAEDFITNWAKEASPAANFGLAVHLERPAGLVDEPAELREAIHEFFRHRADLSRRRMRELLRRGRTNLVIGWWPIRAEARLADRLSIMPVRISYKQDGGADAWRTDWPATSPAVRLG